MRKVRFPRFSTVLTALVAVIALILSVTGDAADEPVPLKAPAADAKPEAAAETKKDPYALPKDDASSQEVTLYMRRLGRMVPAEKTQLGWAVHFNKIDGIIDQLLTRDLDERTRVIACNFKFEVLTVLDQDIGDETAGPRAEAFIAAISKDERPEIASLGQRLGFVQRIVAIPKLDDTERQQLIDDIVAYLQAGPVEGPQVGMAVETADILEKFAPQLAASAYNLFAKYVETAKDPELASMAKSMYGSARRLELPGNPIEVAGTTDSGDDFNIKEYKGKVVLIDFWATFCGPCMEELPAVLDYYAKYHDKGFEIVGISLDENPEALNSFLEQNKIPWLTLFDPDETRRGPANPICRYYGISQIPTMILVNQEGNVVSLEAYSDKLGGLLAELLGPLPEEPAAEDKAASAENPTSKVPTKQPLFKPSK